MADSGTPSEESHSEDQATGPSPLDFDLYIPWACKLLQMEANIKITKVYQSEYVCVALTDRTQKGKNKPKQVPSSIKNDAQEKENLSASPTIMRKGSNTSTDLFINIIATYDSTENLVQIKFEKNRYLPRVMIKVIGLIIQFHNNLNTVTINRGLDQYTIYDICKFLPSSQITNLCLDNCCLNEPNYHLLLEKPSPLKYLSLSRCNIDDSTVESIFSLLIYPLTASKTLSILNLSCNMITDEGANFIAIALRSNRQLSYLNLASNLISDDGASIIFNSLIEFTMTTEEIVASRIRLMADTIQRIRLADAEKKSAKRKSVRASTAKKSKADAFTDADTDNTIMDKAITIMENPQADVDPFSNINTLKRDGVKYCKGNNTLCCLNLSFNHLSYLSLRKLQSVLFYQKLSDRKSRGLVSVSVEGNNMPITCKELFQIDDILNFNLALRTQSTSKKRSPVKATVV